MYNRYIYVNKHDWNMSKSFISNQISESKNNYYDQYTERRILLLNFVQLSFRAVALDLFDLVAYPRPIQKRTGALCMGSLNNMLN